MILPGDPGALDRRLADLQADGTIDDATADEVRTFAEFLALVGPADGGGRQRLLAAGRPDLIDWALGSGE